MLTTDNTSRTVGSNTEGDFAFDGVAPGAVHTIQAQLPGFTTVTREGLVVLPGETMTVALSLKIGCFRPGPPLYGMFGPIDSLLDAEFVAHVRIAEDSYEAQIGTDGDCPRYTYHTSATILQVVTSSRRAWRPGTTIDLYSDGGLAASSEYVAFLSYDNIAGRFKLGEPFIAIPVVSGRVEWGWEGAFGFPDRAPLGRALVGIRETYARHTRYRPLGKEGAEAPLESLRYKTGWFFMGGLEASGEGWLEVSVEPVEPTERPFDLIRESQSSRQLPRRGDRIRLARGGPVSIVNFGSRGEALRDRPPTRENYEASLTNVTGTRVDAGGVYDVADVVLESANNTIRYVWVRLVAVQNNR